MASKHPVGTGPRLAAAAIAAGLCLCGAPPTAAQAPVFVEVLPAAAEQQPLDADDVDDVDDVDLRSLEALEAEAALRLDGAARRAFADVHGSSSVVMTFLAALSEGEDPDYRVRRAVAGVWLEGHGAAPCRHVAGAADLRIHFPDGTTWSARLEPPADPLEQPLCRVLPEAAHRQAAGRRPGLRWAPGSPDELRAGRPVYGLEWPSHAVTRALAEANGQDVDDGMLGDARRLPNLVQAALGGPVEPPLQRLRYAGLGPRADGLGLLDSEGRLRCVVVRAVPGRDGASLCAPRDAAFRGADPAPEGMDVPQRR